jgi:hypothetical protein
MIAIEDYRSIGKAPLESSQIGRPHISGGGEKLHFKASKPLEKRQERLFSSALSDIDDITGLEINTDRQVTMPLADRYFIDAKIADLPELSISRLLFDEPSFVDLLHCAPGKEKVPGNILDRHLPAQVGNIPLEPLIVMLLGISDLQSLVTESITVMAIQSPVLDHEEDTLQPDRHCLNDASSCSLLCHLKSPTIGTTLLPLADVKDDATMMILGLDVPVVDSTESVIYDTGGHLVKPPLKVVLEELFQGSFWDVLPFVNNLRYSFSR